MQRYNTYTQAHLHESVSMHLNVCIYIKSSYPSRFRWWWFFLSHSLSLFRSLSSSQTVCCSLRMCFVILFLHHESTNKLRTNETPIFHDNSIELFSPVLSSFVCLGYVHTSWPPNWFNYTIYLLSERKEKPTTTI